MKDQNDQGVPLEDSGRAPTGSLSLGPSDEAPSDPSRKMRWLVACEFSGVVRDELIALGHDAMSCDLLPSERPGPHYTGDIRNVLYQQWDGMIAFPPCTDLCISGARWWKEKRADGRQQRAIAFFLELANANIPRIAIENPVGIMSTMYRKPDQIIHPWQFGHGEKKRTCLWLKGLPLLTPTNVVEGRVPRIHYMAPGPNRGRERSRTYDGIACAMASQWGGASAIVGAARNEPVRSTEPPKSAAA